MVTTISKIKVIVYINTTSGNKHRYIVETEQSTEKVIETCKDKLLKGNSLQITCCETGMIGLYQAPAIDSLQFQEVVSYGG